MCQKPLLHHCQMSFLLWMNFCLNRKESNSWNRTQKNQPKHIYQIKLKLSQAAILDKGNLVSKSSQEITSLPCNQRNANKQRVVLKLSNFVKDATLYIASYLMNPSAKYSHTYTSLVERCLKCLIVKVVCFPHVQFFQQTDFSLYGCSRHLCVFLSLGG